MPRTGSTSSKGTLGKAFGSDGAAIFASIPRWWTGNPELRAAGSSSPPPCSRRLLVAAFASPRVRHLKESSVERNAQQRAAAQLKLKFAEAGLPVMGQHHPTSSR